MTDTPDELRRVLDEVFLWLKKEHPTAHPAWKSVLATTYTELWNQGLRCDSVGSWYRPVDGGREYVTPISITVGGKRVVLG